MLQCRLAMLEIWRMVIESGYKKSVLCDFSIQNIVASYNCNAQHLNLQELYKKFQTEANYAPGLFPGVVMRFANTKVVYLVFESGKAIITGSQSIEELKKKTIHLKQILHATYGV